MTNRANLGKHASDVPEPSASGREPTLTYHTGTFRKPGPCGPVAWLDVVVVAALAWDHSNHFTRDLIPRESTTRGIFVSGGDGSLSHPTHTP